MTTTLLSILGRSPLQKPSRWKGRSKRFYSRFRTEHLLALALSRTIALKSTTSCRWLMALSKSARRRALSRKMSCTSASSKSMALTRRLWLGQTRSTTRSQSFPYHLAPLTCFARSRSRRRRSLMFSSRLWTATMIRHSGMVSSQSKSLSISRLRRGCVCSKRRTSITKTSNSTTTSRHSQLAHTSHFAYRLNATSGCAPPTRSDLQAKTVINRGS